MQSFDLDKGGYICGISFGYDLKRDDYYTEAPLASLEKMQEETGADTVVLAFHALQDDPQSTVIDYIGEETPTEEGLSRVVKKARELGLRVILKPMLDCRNGIWRGHINFFDKDVPCEPKWCDWFRAYTEYQVHFAKIAERLDVDMLCIACEMVQTQRRDADWRRCIAEIRKHYSGPLTWNADKYQEDEVTFWDALDVISASGYYPIDEWDENLARIEKTVKRFGKPFFFIECGCMTCKTSPAVPNSWIRFHNELVAEGKKQGIDVDKLVAKCKKSPKKIAKCKKLAAVYSAVVDFDSQKRFYENLFNKASKNEFVRGFALWDWEGKLAFDKATVFLDGGYGMHLKPSAEVIKRFYQKNAIQPQS